MRVNHVDTERPNAAARGLSAGIVRTSKSLVIMLMGSVTGPRSRSPIQAHARKKKKKKKEKNSDSPDRQFGSMTEKVADYEKFLRDLMNRVSEEDAAAIRALLEKVGRPLI